MCKSVSNQSKPAIPQPTRGMQANMQCTCAVRAHWQRHGGGGGGRALLKWRGEGGRGSRGGESRPPAGMNHIYQELQKCTTLTHSAYTFVIMSEQSQIIFLGPYIVPSHKHHQATQTGNTVECSLLSNRLPKINQSWTHLSCTHQCHPLLNWKRNQKNLSWMTSHYLGWTHQRGHHLCLVQNHDQCGTCFLCHIVCLLPFLPSPSILEAKIEDRVPNVVAFCAGTWLDWGAEERTYGMLGHGVCNRGKKGYSGVTKEPCYRCAKGAGGKNWPKRNNVPRTLILR